MNVEFDHPGLLLLALVAVPMVLVGWRLLRTMDPVRRTVALGLRTLLVAALAVMLAGPRTVREHDHLTVIGVLDVSGSIRRFAELPTLDELTSPSNLEYLRHWFREATATREPDDRLGLVVFDGEAVAITVPTRRDPGEVAIDVTTVEGTNIADAVDLALAMLPPDTARRLVLVSDGNETIGRAVEAARSAAADDGHGVPIDVLPIEYRVRSDVQIVRVETPSTARPGQTVTVRVILEATADTEGVLTLEQEGAPVDINGAAPGRGRTIRVPAGQSVQLAQVELLETPVNRFEAVFEPSSFDDDRFRDNNRAEAFTATPSRGKVLVADVRAGTEPSWLAGVLDEAGIPHEHAAPSAIPVDLISLQRYDLVILDNVPVFALSIPQQEMLARYVHDLGGGLIMVGGLDGFGAGGWNGSPVEEVLPLEMDPPKELVLPSAAVVLVLDKSGSMDQNVAGARATQQTIANEAAALAIETLRSDALVGVVAFDSFAYEKVPLQRNSDPKAIAEQIRGISAEGGTQLRPALAKARRMLQGVEVNRKRVVCLSDGESPTDGLEELVRDMVAEDIVLTTIAVGDQADEETLRTLAEIGGGEFHAVRNPRQLPRVLVDSVQVINKPLIKEKPFVPVVRATGSSLTAGMAGAPQLGGLVITAPRSEPTVVVEMTHTDGEPLLAHWQAGLGRSAAFTSDTQGTWSESWHGWPTATTFWTQLVRTIARPTVDLQTELVTLVVDDRLDITLEAAAPDGGFLDHLVVDGAVYAPDGRSIPVRLRQTAPGRYQGSVPAVAAGNYVVALSPRRGDERMPPAIGGASKPSSPEFRQYVSNVALLDDIVQLTGGRRLDLDAPQAVDLFDRTGMAPSRSSLPAWRGILWVALALLLLDVACRRIAWDSRQVKLAVARAWARVIPSSVKGQAAQATLDSLRTVSERTAATHTESAEPAKAASEPAASASSTRPVPPAPSRAPKSEPEPEIIRPDKRRPDPKKVAAALDAMLGRPTEAKPKPPPEPEPDEAAPDETTSSLLAAKRRRQGGSGEG